MQIDDLTVPGAYLLTPTLHTDPRGVFLEWYRFEPLRERIGEQFELRQANLSVSSRGVLRGIHYALTPPGQAKYVTVVAGAAIDFVIDLRLGSPTFGNWEAVTLDDVDRRAVYLAQGLGHAFVALSTSTTVCYLSSEVYRPEREFAISPLDPDIGLGFPPDLDVVLSDRDRSAPSLAAMRHASLLPQWPTVPGNV